MSLTERRMVSVWLPHLPIERLKRERTGAGAQACEPVPDTAPFALVGNGPRGLELMAVNAASAGNGLRPGQGLADARAICPRLLTAPAAPDKDAAQLRALARWSSRYSARLNVDGGDGLWLDITGVSHLFGGESALLADLEGRLARAGLTARLGAAETLGAAHALARFARHSPTAASDGALHASLAPLPIEALRLQPETAHLLRRLGLKRIGQLYDLPRASLERRFHAQDRTQDRTQDLTQAVLRRLDQALGLREEKREALLPSPDFTAKLFFAEPLMTHDGVMAALSRLAEKLCLSLTQRSRGARRVTLWVARMDGSSAALEAGLSAPSREAAHLMRLLKDKIETIDMGFGIDFMMLASLATEKLVFTQTRLTEAHETAGPESLIDTLSNRLGPRAVGRLSPRASHIPERAQVSHSAFAAQAAWADAAAIVEKPPRPPLLLAEPEPVTVLAEIPEGPPARFTWRRVSRRVTKAEGPERIAPEWWRHSSPSIPAESGKRIRDYYRIEDDRGCRYWLFREGLYREDEETPPGWFLHGVFP